MEGKKAFSFRQRSEAQNFETTREFCASGLARSGLKQPRAILLLKARRCVLPPLQGSVTERRGRGGGGAGGQGVGERGEGEVAVRQRGR